MPMKTVIQLSLLFAFYALQANEFPLVQPISVERAPLNQVVQKKQEPTITKKVVKKVPKKKANNTKTDTIVLNIKFQNNSVKLKENSTQVLEEFSTSLLENKASQVVIYAYTDSSGEKEANLILSQKRANAVIDFLHKTGVSSTRLTAIGMGEKDPIADNTTEEGRETNRRIEALIIE